MLSFTIPAGDNTITELDIKSGILRITTEVKAYFPNERCEILIDYEKKFTRKVKFEYREGRSHRLHMGKEFMVVAGITPGSKLKFFGDPFQKEFFVIEKIA